MPDLEDMRLHVPDPTIPAEWNELTRRIIGCAYEVHSTLGPGLLERLYEDALCWELGQAGIRYERQVTLRVPYKSIVLSEQRFDVVVENLVLLELKAVEKVPDVHLATMVSYLRAAGLPLGLLVNFNSLHLRDGIYRRANTARRYRSLSTSTPSVPSVPSAFNPS